MRNVLVLLWVGLALAAALAEEPGRSRWVPGDLNADGVVDGLDRALMPQLLAENVRLAGNGRDNASLDGQPGSNALDAVLLQLTPDTWRGELLDAVLIDTYFRTGSNFLLNAVGLNRFTPVRHIVDLYRLTYRTVDPFRRWTEASGLAVLPREAPVPLSVVSLQHGTISDRYDAPSGGDSNEASLAARVFASSGGYAVVAPDYLGLGVSPGLHPYVHAHSEATAGVDMLRAFDQFAASWSLDVSGRLFLAGYSQGGHATMALLRELEWWHDDEFLVSAAAPAAGPYDLSGVMVEAMLEDGNPFPAQSYYLAYCLLSFNHLYHLSEGLHEIFVPPYDALVPELYDGTNGAAVIITALPLNPRDMLQPAFLAGLLNDPDHPFRQAAQLNDLWDWRPQAVVRLYHGGADRDVPIANAVRAADRMTELGATVTLVNLGPLLDHVTTVLPATAAIRDWFDEWD